MPLLRSAAMAALLMCLAAPATQAAPIILGGTNLLTPADASQLETWLGTAIGSLTNVFDKVAGDLQDSFSFHAAADELGPTFSVFRVRNVNDPDEPESYRIIGGYNPRSWYDDSNFGYVITPPEDRTGFIFNLSTSTVIGQGSGPDGQYQSLNGSGYGPTWGGGHDLTANTGLESGYAFPYSYGVPFGTNILGGTPYTEFMISDLEVFTIQEGQDEPAPVPEPSTLLLFGAGLAAAARNHFRRQRR